MQDNKMNLEAFSGIDIIEEIVVKTSDMEVVEKFISDNFPVLICKNYPISIHDYPELGMAARVTNRGYNGEVKIVFQKTSKWIVLYFRDGGEKTVGFATEEDAMIARLME